MKRLAEKALSLSFLTLNSAGSYRKIRLRVAICFLISNYGWDNLTSIMT